MRCCPAEMASLFLQDNDLYLLRKTKSRLQRDQVLGSRMPAGLPHFLICGPKACSVRVRVAAAAERALAYRPALSVAWTEASAGLLPPPRDPQPAGR